MRKYKDYKEAYNSSYYEKRATRFEKEKYKSFGIYFRKFSIKEPLLDLGCGTGPFLKEARRLGYKKVVGLEINDYAVRKAERQGLKAYRYNGRNIPFENNFFGTVFCYQVIEHVPRKEANFLLKECYRVLKPGGNLLLFAPAEYAESYNADPTHINFYSIKYFKDRITNFGFKINSFESTMYLPSPIRNLKPFSYIVSKLLYRLFGKFGTSIELEATKV